MPPSPAVFRREVRHFLRRLALLIGAICALVLTAGAGLALFEDRSYWFALTWAIDIVATIGSTPAPESVGGQVVKLVLIALGLGTMFYVLVTVAELFVAGHLSGLLEARAMQRRIADLNDHFLICGFGRVGRQVARDLREAGADFVVIDDNPEVREEMEAMGCLHIDGAGSDDETLTAAGIERARAVIACVDSDPENVFIALTARELRPDIEIVARASEEASERKLLRAGADHVVSPYKASGDTMTRLALGAERVGEVAEAATDGQASSGHAWVGRSVPP